MIYIRKGIWLRQLTETLTQIDQRRDNKRILRNAILILLLWLGTIPIISHIVRLYL